MIDSDKTQLLALLSAYAADYGDEAEPGMTVRELADDIYTSLPHTSDIIATRERTNYNRIKSVFVLKIKRRTS